MRADNLLPHGWLRTYRWAIQEYDLVPFWYQTEWSDIPLELGSAGSQSIQLGDDFWFYQLGIGGQADVQIEDPPAAPQAEPKIPGLFIRMRIDGNPVTGDFAPALMYIGGAMASGFGPGWVLRRGSVVTIEWFRPTAADDDTLSEQAQFVLHGCQLAKRGAATYDRNRWRNMTLADLDKRARLAPMSYNTTADLGWQANSNANLQIRIRDRNFILRSIRPYSLGPDEVPLGNFNLLGGGIAGLRLWDQGGNWHDQGQAGISAMGLCGDPVIAPYDLRIPRIVPANRDVNIIMESYAWNQQPEEDRMVGVLMTGYEIIGDRRGKPPGRDPRDQIPYYYRPGAR